MTRKWSDDTRDRIEAQVVPDDDPAVAAALRKFMDGETEVERRKQPPTKIGKKRPRTGWGQAGKRVTNLSAEELAERRKANTEYAVRSRSLQKEMNRLRRIELDYGRDSERYAAQLTVVDEARRYRDET